MTVQVQTPYNSSIANGITTIFPYSFTLLELTDLVVEIDGVVQTTGFSVSGVGTPAGGNVTFAVAPANGATVLRRRDLPFQRLTDYQYSGDFQEATLDNDFDRLWQALQQLGQDLLSSIKLPFNTATDQIITEDEVARAGKTLVFDALGNISMSSYALDAIVIDATAQAAAASASAASASASASSSGASATASLSSAVLAASYAQLSYISDYGLLSGTPTTYDYGSV